MTLSRGEVAKVRQLDPLDLDRRLANLWWMNHQADVPALAGTLASMVPALNQVAAFTVLECLAATRDLGILLGSIRRHGVQPVDLVPQVEPVLVKLGARTGFIPRDTVQHYITFNPTGHRERRYTGQPMEGSFLSAARATLSESDVVRGHVTPEYYALTMRPYFGDVRVAGVHHPGPDPSVRRSPVGTTRWAG